MSAQSRKTSDLTRERCGHIRYRFLEARSCVLPNCGFGEQTTFFRTSVAERTFFWVPGLAVVTEFWFRDGCADEDENPGLSQTPDPAAS